MPARPTLAAFAVASLLLVGTARASVPQGRLGSPVVSTQHRIAILCYHDISDDRLAPLQTVSADFLRRQIRACRAAGWTFVALSTVIAERQHPERLPARTLVLTFDDGYRSFRERALPVLREEHVPATLAVITGLVDSTRADLPPIMGWDELREVFRDSLVTIASHSHALHRYETSDPYRDTTPSVSTRRYLLAESRYETREEYRARIRADLDTTQRVLRERLGNPADVLVWPYGAHNEMSRGLAQAFGFRVTLALGGREVTAADLRLGCLPRIMVTRKFRFDAGDAAWLSPPRPPMQAADVDLDDVYSPDPKVFRDRVEQVVRRVRSIGATHVFLSVCSDTASDRRLQAAWCMNHQVFVRANIWGMVAARLAQSRIRVWARVPTMNLTWVWQQRPEWRLGTGVTGGRTGAAAAPTLAAEWPTRLSPDLPEVQRAAIDFLTDLAVYAPIDGIVFDRDAAMAPGERMAIERSDRPADAAEVIDQMLDRCRDAVRAWRPECQFGRVIDASVVDASGVDAVLAQDYAHIVRANDVTVVAADPWTASHEANTHWVEQLGRKAIDRATAHGGPATSGVLIELQALDRGRGRWLAGRDLMGLAAAARRAHVAQFGVSPVTPTSGELPESLLDSAATPPLVTRDAPR